MYTCGIIAQGFFWRSQKIHCIWTQLICDIFEALMSRYTDSHAEGMAACSGDVLDGADSHVGWIILLSTRDQSIREDLCESSVSSRLILN